LWEILFILICVNLLIIFYRLQNCKGISFNEDTITFIIKKQGLVPEEIGEIAKFFSLLNNTAKQLSTPGYF
jgi:hypothetical protein